ncbi:hypothetical protein [Levilactobacillus brevis]|uniref:hypothetical protein n=1 Tax=Levilactobacillus brevis TaxID=1580 RepID=UPI002165A6E1|nr:hypothetical protein [Levilactobacillus brevis]MCT3565306.1 hypothetical protein [Levilactobacillus brevis]UVW18076.1 hypothetical protein NX820_09190 [Levilactobacillus brevis]
MENNKGVIFLRNQMGKLNALFISAINAFFVAHPHNWFFMVSDWLVREHGKRSSLNMVIASVIIWVTVVAVEFFLQEGRYLIFNRSQLKVSFKRTESKETSKIDLYVGNLTEETIQNVTVCLDFKVRSLHLRLFHHYNPELKLNFSGKNLVQVQPDDIEERNIHVKESLVTVENIFGDIKKGSKADNIPYHFQFFPVAKECGKVTVIPKIEGPWFFWFILNQKVSKLTVTVKNKKV